MKYWILPVALLLAACDVKVKTKDDKTDPPAKPVCTRQLERGSVRTQSCDLLVVGKDSNGEITISQFDPQGQPGPVMRPLSLRYGNLDLNIQRLAVINDAFFALGTWRKDSGSRQLFAFRFLDNGFLDLNFGPRRDGVLMEDVNPRYSLVSVGIPVIEGDRLRLTNRSEDAYMGTVVDRDQVVLISGSEAMPKDMLPLPATCDIINHQSMTNEGMVQITQNTCAELNWRSQSARGDDSLVMALNGSTYFSNFLGEMRWFYEGSSLVLMSRNGLGFVKKEYVRFVQGPSNICGAAVNANQRYLVFSAKTPENGDWLEDCWFL